MTVDASVDPWFRVYRREPAAQLRLFCFPYAGAGPSVFAAWAGLLGPRVEIVGVEYPGRESRSRERLTTHLGDLVSALAACMGAWTSLPFAFFGHSMGGLLCFELARALEAGGRPVPEHVFVSAAGVPHLPETMPLHELPDVALLRALVRLNGLPPEVLRNPELLVHALPILRADLQVCERRSLEPGSPLMAPLSVYGGAGDARVGPERLSAWRSLAGAAYRERVFRGDHFYIKPQRAALLASIGGELGALIRPPALTAG